MTVVDADTSRRIATLLFTDIVDSTTHAARLGDAGWRALIARHDAMVRDHLNAHGGTELSNTGDGFFVLFDRPAAAVECAAAVVRDARTLGIGVRAGIHAGECDVQPHAAKGIAVHIANRISDLAAADQVLVSQTVHDLTSGSGFAFTRHSRAALRGVPGRWSLYALGITAPVAPPRQPSRRRTGGGATAGQRQAALRVLVVDDHPLWRESIAAVMRQAKFTVVGEAETASGGAAIAAVKKPDVVLMDYELAGGDDGLAATEQIRTVCPDARVLFLSASDDRANVVAAVRAGANGYLVKTSRSAEVVEAVRRVRSGELVLPPTVAGYVLDELRGTTVDRDASAGLDQLTARELDIIALMADGLSNQAICTTLHLNAKTVEGHVSNIFQKLGLMREADTHRRVLAVLIYLRARDQG